MIKKTILIVPTIVGACLAGCGGAGGGEVLATVQGDSITVDQFNNYLGAKPTVRVIDNNQIRELPLESNLAFQTVRDLVSRTVLYQMAKDEKLMPTPEEVNKELEFQKELDPNFIRAYQARGLLIGQIREEIRFAMVQERLLTKGIQVTDADVDQWLKANPRALIQPSTVEMTWVLATTEARKAEVDRQLKLGKPFKDVAVQLSQAPNAAMVNAKFLPERGPLPIAALPPALRTKVAAAQPGTVTDWIQSSEGWAKFMIDAKNPEKEIELTPARRENIRRNLALQRGQRANDLQTRLADRIRETEIVIKREALKELWKRFDEMLKAQADQAAKQAERARAESGASLPTGAGDGR
jgi:foldase protein PrsA